MKQVYGYASAGSADEKSFSPAHFNLPSPEENLKDPSELQVPLMDKNASIGSIQQQLRTHLPRGTLLFRIGIAYW